MEKPEIRGFAGSKMRIAGLLTAIFILSIIVVQEASAGNGSQKAAWTKAEKAALKESKNKNAVKRREVTASLVEAIFSDVEVDAAETLVKQIVNEINFGKDKKEKQIDGIVLSACVDGLKKLSDEKAVDKLIDAINNKKKHNNRMRFYFIKGLGGIKNDRVTELLPELLKEDADIIKIAALDALFEQGSDSSVSSIFELLHSDETWEIKHLAVKYIGQFNNDEVIKGLIDVLRTVKLKWNVKSEVVNVLIKFTRVDYGADGEGWYKWYSDKTEDKKGENDNQFNTTVAQPPKYYGVDITSAGVVFVLDISGSMGWKTTVEAGTVPTGKLDDNSFFGANEDPAKIKLLKDKVNEIVRRGVASRVDAAKCELVTAIGKLNPETTFTVIFFSTGVYYWKEELVLAVVDNKIAAVEYIDRQGPVGSTATYDAIESAYKIDVRMGKGGESIAEVFGGADTIFVVTDGYPTSGNLIAVEDIIEEIAKISEIRKVKINTIAIGSFAGVPADIINNFGIKAALPDVEFLRKLAEKTEGVFVDRTTK